jgi:hypothetical protein
MSVRALATLSRRPQWLALGAALVLGLAVGHDLLHMPLQVEDSFTLVLDAVRGASVWSEVQRQLFYAHYFRPGYYATIKLVADLSGGDYVLAFRLYHAALVVAFVLLFTMALRVRDRIDLAVVPLALSVFLGIHTFLGTVREAWPISHFLQVAVLAFAALNLAQSRGGWLVDLGLGLLFLLASATLESGLIVWVIVVCAWISGMPGTSRRSVIIVTLLLGVYAWLRFGQVGTELPTVDERATGYLFERLEPSQIRERFGDNLLALYVYNVASSILSVLLSEPRAGVWVTTRAFVNGQVEPREIIHLGSSLFATGLIAAYVVDRIRAGVRWPVSLADQHLVVFAGVLAANAAISYVYTKDEIMTMAGAFYALPVYGAAVHFLRRWPERSHSAVATVLVGLIFLAGSAAWATRAVGVHHVLRLQAFNQRNDWTRMEREWKATGEWRRYEDSEALIRRIHDESVRMQVVNPEFLPRWMDDVFDNNW